MFTLSTRAKEAIKTGLAVVIAYAIPLQLGWEKPFWAAFAVLMISMDTAGQSLNKGALRMLGTLVAGAVAMSFIALFPQERWLMVLSLSLYYGLCTYMMMGSKRPYFWFVSAFVCMVIIVDAAPSDSLRSFQIVVARVQETGMGILVYSLVSALLWPRSSRADLEDASRSLSATQRRLYQSYWGLMAGQGTAEDSRSLRMQEVQLLGQVGQALNAAVTDSYPVWEVRRRWRRFHQLSAELMESLERWRESFPEIRQLDLRQPLPSLEAVGAELDSRCAEIERMLAGERPTTTPQTIRLAVNREALGPLTHFQKAAVAVASTELNRLEVLTRSLHGCVADIKGFAAQEKMAKRTVARKAGPVLDPDGLAAAGRIMVTQWIAFAIWLYVDPPGHALYVFMTLQWTLAALMLRINPLAMLPGFLLAIALAGVVYVFVMPHLSGYAQLGLMLFGVTFGAFYLMSEPRHRITRTTSMANFHVMIGILNEQTYDFANFLSTSASVLLSLALVVALRYIPRSPRPEKVFLRLLRRYFRHAEFLMSRATPEWTGNRGLIGRWRAALYGRDLLDLPPKLAAWGGQIDARAFPDNKPEQIQALVTALQTLAYRMKALIDASEHPQAALLLEELRDDVRAWRVLVQTQFGLWAEDPEAEVEPGIDAQERLIARLARLEARIEEVFGRVGQGQLTSEDYENFYRLLGSHRGLSESGIEYLRLAERINWAQWQEARF